jgi:hypothetical protein
MRVHRDARRINMSFALLLSHLPHIEESRVHYDAMLSLQPAPQSRLRRFAAFCRGLRSLY